MFRNRKGLTTKLWTILLATIIITATIVGIFAYYMYNKPEPAPESPTLRIEADREGTSIDPAVSPGSLDNLFDYTGFDNLYSLRGNKSGDVTPKPALAESNEVTADGRTWTFHLRQDAKFSNGDPINATAVVYSFDRLFKMGPAAEGMWAWEGVVSEGNYQATDTYTVRITLDAPFAGFPQLLSLWFPAIVNPRIVEANGGVTANATNSKIMVTPLEGLYSGPYKIVGFQPGVGGHIDFEWNEYWYGWKELEPNVKKVHISWTSEAATKIMKLSSGETDFLYNLPASLLPQVLGIEGVSIEKHDGWTQHCIIFSGVGKLGMDEKGLLVRQALCYSFPYEEVLKYAYGGLAKRSGSGLPSQVWGATSAFKDKYSFSLNKTAELLDQAGYTADPVTGNRMSLTAYFALGAEERKQTFLMWQARLAEIGVTLDVREAAWTVIANAMRAGQADISSSQWSPDYGDPDDFATPAYAGESSYSWIGSSWKIPELSALVLEAKTETNQTRRLTLYAQIQEWGTENPGRMWYAQLDDVQVHRSDWHGYFYNPIIKLDFTRFYKEP